MNYQDAKRLLFDRAAHATPGTQTWLQGAGEHDVNEAVIDIQRGEDPDAVLAAMWPPAATAPCSICGTTIPFVPGANDPRDLLGEPICPACLCGTIGD